MRLLTAGSLVRVQLEEPETEESRIIYSLFSFMNLYFRVRCVVFMFNLVQFICILPRAI